MKSKKVLAVLFTPSVLYGLWIATWIQNYFIPDGASWIELDDWWAMPLFFTNVSIFIAGIFVTVCAFIFIEEN